MGLRTAGMVRAGFRRGNQPNAASSSVQFWVATADSSVPNAKATDAVDFTVSRAQSGGTVSSTLANTSNTASSKALFLIQVGGTTADDPMVQWSISGGQAYTAGIDNSASDTWKLSVGSVLGTTDSLIVDTSGSVGIFTAPTIQGLSISKSNSGGPIHLVVQNTSNTASSKAQMLFDVAGASADDPWIQFSINSIQVWSVGIDNSDFDRFKVSSGSTLGTNDAIVITTGLNVLVGTGAGVASTRLRVGADQTVASASGAIWDGIDLIAATLTLTGTTAVTTATGVNFFVVRGPTITDSSAVTVTAAATCVISDRPQAGGSVTITSNYTLWIQQSVNSGGQWVRWDSGTGSVAAATASGLFHLRKFSSGESTGNVIWEIDFLYGAGATFGSSIVGGVDDLALDAAPNAGSGTVHLQTATVDRVTITNAQTLVTNRHNTSKGADVASGNTMTLGTGGNIFTITGTTTINGIVTANWTAGATITLIFAAALTVTHNSGAPGGGAVAILLVAGANLTTAANMALTLVYNGTNWIQPKGN